MALPVYPKGLDLWFLFIFNCFALTETLVLLKLHVRIKHNMVWILHIKEFYVNYSRPVGARREVIRYVCVDIYFYWHFLGYLNFGTLGYFSSLQAHHSFLSYPPAIHREFASNSFLHCFPRFGTKLPCIPICPVFGSLAFNFLDFLFGCLLSMSYRRFACERL